jgi:hypothetical protein
MRGRGNGSEASVLRIVTSAERERPYGSRPKTGRGAGSADFNGRPTYAQCPPVDRSVLPPSGPMAQRGKPAALSGQGNAEVHGVAQPQGREQAEPVQAAGGSERRPVMGRRQVQPLPDAARPLPARRGAWRRATQPSVNRGSVYSG